MKLQNDLESGIVWIFMFSLSNDSMKRKLLQSAMMLLVFPSCFFAQDNGNLVHQNPTVVLDETGKSRLFLDVLSASGSHRNALGLGAGALRYISFPVISRVEDRVDLDEQLGLLGRVCLRYDETDFGFPGTSYLAEARLKLLYSFGERNRLFKKYAFIHGYGRNNLGFGLNGYLATDATSQVTGQIDYSYIKDDFAFLVNYENDTIVLLQDKYRTTAVKISSLFDLGSDLIGVSIGFNLWAGERIVDLCKIWNHGNIQVPAEVQRGQTVTLYGGKQYSTDVVYLSFVYNDISCSIGYDSEIFKQLIQNNVHYLLNDGNLPILDRPDRVFFELRIGMLDDLF
jgi:hypothetical protein